MAFIRVKSRRGRRYAYLVESRWEPGATSPRQRVLRYLGPEDRVTIDDVPEDMRDEPAVQRWLAARAAPIAKAIEPAEAERMRDALRDALRNPERAVLDELARAGIANAGTWTYLRDVVAPVLHRIGDEWHAGRINVADEHVATRAVLDLVRRMRDQERERSGKRRGDRLMVVLANPEGEEHSVALEMLECRLASLGHRTLVLAGGTPKRDVALRAKEARADVVLISASDPARADEALACADAVLDRCPGALVAVGGQAFADPQEGGRVRVLPPRQSAKVDTLVEEALRRRLGVDA